MVGREANKFSGSLSLEFFSSRALFNSREAFTPFDVTIGGSSEEILLKDRILAKD